MAGLPGLQRTDEQFRQLQSAAFGASVNKAANLGKGSTIGGVLYAERMLALALQSQIDYVSTLSRLRDGNGNLQVFGLDIDSFANPWGVFRLTSGAATTSLTLSIASVANAPVTIPVGAIFQRGDGIQYVLTDNGLTTLGNYVIPPGSLSTSASAACLTLGTIGNTAANTITVSYGGPGVTSSTTTILCTNPTAVTNGTDAESDNDFAARFELAMTGGVTGTANAILNAALSVQIGLTVQIGDGLDQFGVAKNSWFTVIVNVRGSSGSPTSGLLAAVHAAVDAVRSAGIEFVVIGPTLLPIVAAGNIKLDGSVPWSIVGPAATLAFQTFVNNIGLYPIQSQSLLTVSTLPYAQCLAAVMKVPGIAYVSGFTIQGGFADISIPYATQVVAPGAPAFNPE